MFNDINPRKRGDGLGVRQASPTQDSEPAFQPPEQVANNNDRLGDISNPQVVGSTSLLKFGLPDSSARSKRGGIHLPFGPLSKKQMIIVAAAFVVLFGGGGAVYALTHKQKAAPAPVAATPTPAPAKVEEVVPTTVASPLTGITVQPEQAKLPVTGIMIENSPDARPQSGLKDAGVVYEAIAEGGITRFLALYQEAEPDYIGPVRSARPYYLEWLQGYDAAIAHVGGSPEALALIKTVGIKDLDQFANSGAYWRISSRYAPHNMYTSIAKLRDAGAAKGYTTSTFAGFVRKPEKVSGAPTAKTVDLTMSGYLYNVHYDYSADTNSYLRSEGGKPHKDDKSGTQLNAKVVVAIVVPYGIKSDGLHSDYQTTGSGKAFIFQDGAVTEGIWEKKGSKEPLVLGDANGAPLAINPGQTWVTAVATAEKVKYAP